MARFGSAAGVQVHSAWAAGVHRAHRHVGREGVGPAQGVEPPAPLGQIGRPGARGQRLPQSRHFVQRHHRVSAQTLPRVTQTSPSAACRHGRLDRLGAQR